jgi:hypothetical protein
MHSVYILDYLTALFHLQEMYCVNVNGKFGRMCEEAFHVYFKVTTSRIPSKGVSLSLLTSIVA